MAGADSSHRRQERTVSTDNSDAGAPEQQSPYEVLHPAYLRGLGFQLIALRRLPPGWHAQSLERAEDDALFQQLLRLPDTSDPLGWLLHEHDSEVARQTLYEA